MDLQLTNKVVLVTGGAKIGEAIVRSVAAEGGIPVIVDRNGAAAKELASQLPRARPIVVDLASPENCNAAVVETIDQFGTLDALVNHAGIKDKVGLEQGSPEEYVESLKRNLLYYYNMAHFALPHLKKVTGSIINIASKAAVAGPGETSGYASLKGAILALTREWAAELAPYGMRVNAVIPAPEEQRKSIRSKVPLEKRMTLPDEIAAMVVFLLSSRAGHVTGQHLFVDGGYGCPDRALT